MSRNRELSDFAATAVTDANGNVGIGATPVSVSGYKTLTLNASTGGIIYIQNNGTNVLQLSADGGSIGISAVTGLPILMSGEVLVGGATDNGAYNLQCNGTGVWGAGAYVNGSDQRLKKDIQDIDGGLDTVAKMRPVKFSYRQDTGYTTDTTVQTGFIAQELLSALDGKQYAASIVKQGPDYLSVAYQSLIPILTKAIQELHERVEALEKK